METKRNTSPRNTLKLRYLAPLAGLIAAMLNAVLFWIGTALGTFPPGLVIPSSGEPFTVGAVAFSSFMPALVAGLLLFLLIRFARKPLHSFNVIALLVLVLSVVTPFSLPAAPIGLIVLLEVMHLVVAAVIVFLFNRYAN